MDILWPKVTIPPEIDDEAHIWAVPLEATGVELAAHKATLSKPELESAQAFVTDELRTRYIVAHGALRMVLALYLDVEADEIEFVFEHRGKPRLAEGGGGRELKFNLSHSADLALVAVAKGCEVGVDVERHRPVRDLDQLARRYFHPMEVLDVTAANDRVAAFFKCWTAKEAVLKAFGSGIAESLDHFHVPSVQTASGWVDVSTMPTFAKADQCWVTRLSPAKECEAAIAFRGPERAVRCFMFEM